MYGRDILSHMDHIKASITSTFGSILKMDSTKKITKHQSKVEMQLFPAPPSGPQLEMQFFPAPPSGPQMEMQLFPGPPSGPKVEMQLFPDPPSGPHVVLQLFPAPPLGSMIYTPVSSQFPVLVAAPQALNASLSLLFLLLLLVLLHTAKH
ncbi:proline-rich protein HaeIII subfamily 1-like [Notothenia coriiceps]|uniref:Proline-rich protein HaeIII subfamily 1-like n=1 Tax=Notothenia coriiceps TaxID=8208 RepID=A0A6I9NZ05_9TELE|nr:PREDICTED: proline-rich protein HaeIII subfamily 1-like [Notothenia coriiceps]XP_010780356.1 PREDICTED: proline-rich protein HaeIII subfamily 1-like [Notothenia coriiceps]